MLFKSLRQSVLISWQYWFSWKNSSGTIKSSGPLLLLPFTPVHFAFILQFEAPREQALITFCKKHAENGKLHE